MQMKNARSGEDGKRTGKRLPLDPPFFYGWVMVGIGAMSLFFSGIGQSYSLSVFIDRYLNDFAWDRTFLSGMYSLATVCSGSLLFVIGRWDGPLRFAPHAGMGRFIDGIGVFLEQCCRRSDHDVYRDVLVAFLRPRGAGHRSEHAGSPVVCSLSRARVEFYGTGASHRGFDVSDRESRDDRALGLARCLAGLGCCTFGGFRSRRLHIGAQLSGGSRIATGRDGRSDETGREKAAAAIRGFVAYVGGDTNGSLLGVVVFRFCDSFRNHGRHLSPFFHSGAAGFFTLRRRVCTRYRSLDRFFLHAAFRFCRGKSESAVVYGRHLFADVGDVGRIAWGILMAVAGAVRCFMGRAFRNDQSFLGNRLAFFFRQGTSGKHTQYRDVGFRVRFRSGAGSVRVGV